MFAGEEDFLGEILHSHDFKGGEKYKGRRILCVGGSWSAEDICLQCWKSGAKYSHISSRKPIVQYGDWPENFKENVILKYGIFEFIMKHAEDEGYM